MNRLHQVAEAHTVPFDDDAYASEVTPATRSEDEHYTLFSPMHYEPGYAYPLIVWLHGPVANEQQLNQVMPLVSMRNYVAVSPRGTAAVIAAPGVQAYDWRQTDRHIQLAEEQVFAAVDAACEKFHVARSRIFLAGFGSGGTMALRLTMNNPGSFAGGLSLCGRFPTGLRPLRHLHALRDLPLFMAVGCMSEDYSADEVCRDLRLFHTAGLSVSLRQYPCDDELTTLMLEDMNRWIMQHICPSQATSSEASGKSGSRVN